MAAVTRAVRTKLIKLPGGQVQATYYVSGGYTATDATFIETELSRIDCVIGHSVVGQTYATLSFLPNTVSMAFSTTVNGMMSFKSSADNVPFYVTIIGIE